MVQLCNVYQLTSDPWIQICWKSNNEKRESMQKCQKGAGVAILISEKIDFKSV